MAESTKLQTVTVLISSVGRRSQLIECFREAFRALGVRGRVIGTDIVPEHASAAHLVDKCYRVQRCNDPEFIEEILRIAGEEEACLIVPTIDPELPVYAANRERFLDRGITVGVGPANRQDRL